MTIIHSYYGEVSDKEKKMSLLVLIMTIVSSLEFIYPPMDFSIFRFIRPLNFF